MSHNRIVRVHTLFRNSEHAHRSEFSFHGTKYSILPALSLDGIIHLEVVKNAVTGNEFHQFVQGLIPLMNKWPLPNSVLIVNNSSIHKVEGICEMIEEHGACLLYLPSYLLDLNLIELAFSSIKAWLCTCCDRINIEHNSKDGNIYDTFWEAVFSVMVESARGWYKHCGY